MTRTLIYDDEAARQNVRPLYRGTQIVWYVFYFVEALLLFRFALKLLGANPAAGFSQLIYGMSYPLVAPFLYVFGSPRVLGSTIEWSTLLAMLVYWLLAWAVVRLIVMGKPLSHAEAREGLQEQDFNP